MWKLRALVVWEEKYGPVAKGLLIHHKNRDTLDDSLTNLVAMNRAQHLLEHKHEFEERRLAALRARHKLGKGITDTLRFD